MELHPEHENQYPLRYGNMKTNVKGGLPELFLFNQMFHLGGGTLTPEVLYVCLLLSGHARLKASLPFCASLQILHRAAMAHVNHLVVMNPDVKNDSGCCL